MSFAETLILFYVYEKIKLKLKLGTEVSFWEYIHIPNPVNSKSFQFASLCILLCRPMVSLILKNQDPQNYICENRVGMLDNQQRFLGGLKWCGGCSHITNTSKFYESNKLIVVVVTPVPLYLTP